MTGTMARAAPRRCRPVHQIPLASDPRPPLILDKHSQHDDDVAVGVRRAGRSRGRVVVDAGVLDDRPEPRRGRVVQRERQPLGLSDERLDCREEESRDDLYLQCLRTWGRDLETRRLLLTQKNPPHSPPQENGPMPPKIAWTRSPAVASRLAVSFSLVFFLSAAGALGGEPSRSTDASPGIPVTVALDKPGIASIVVERADGTRVANLIAETPLAAGRHTFYWDGYDVGLQTDENSPHVRRRIEPGTYRV